MDLYWHILDTNNINSIIKPLVIISDNIQIIDYHWKFRLKQFRSLLASLWKLQGSPNSVTLILLVALSFLITNGLVLRAELHFRYNISF